MTFAIILVITIACCCILRTPIMHCPVAFYAICIAVDVLFAFGVAGMLPRSLWMALYNPIRKAMVPLAMFVVVMYIGVFPKDGKVAKWLRPIRAELSIMACLLIIGHVAVYLTTYIQPLFGSQVKTNVVAALAVAMVLLVLLLILGVTSFGFVKKRMSARSWKNVQKWSYVFFILIYVHLMLIFGKAALAGGEHAVESVVVYSVVFLGYIIARSIRGALDKKAKTME